MFDTAFLWRHPFAAVLGAANAIATRNAAPAQMEIRLQTFFLDMCPPDGTEVPEAPAYNLFAYGAIPVGVSRARMRA